MPASAARKTRVRSSILVLELDIHSKPQFPCFLPTSFISCRVYLKHGASTHWCFHLLEHSACPSRSSRKRDSRRAFHYSESYQWGAQGSTSEANLPPRCTFTDHDALQKPDHMAKNPFGKVPVLIDGHLTLFGAPRSIPSYLGTSLTVAVQNLARLLVTLQQNTETPTRL
jgi:hypothetical protein